MTHFARCTDFSHRHRRELRRRQQLALEQSLSEPHLELADFADQGFSDWARSLASQPSKGRRASP